MEDNMIKYNLKREDMEYDWWMALPIEARKAMVKKRMETAKKMQGSITCEKYGVYMKP